MKVKDLEKWNAIRMEDRTILSSDLSCMSAEQKIALGELDVEPTGRKGYYRLISITSNLNRIRTAAGISQSKLADLSGVNIRMIQYYEQGQKDINKAQGDSLYRLASALGVKIEDILELDKI